MRAWQYVVQVRIKVTHDGSGYLRIGGGIITQVGRKEWIMHYHAEVWIKTNEDIESQIEKIMAPYNENLEVEQREEDGETYWTNPDGFWDWWQIGGRWKGQHVANYDSMEDPDHMQICEICYGTGDRPGWVTYGDEGERLFKDDWARECNGCNSCNGTGSSLKWTTQWLQHPQDVIPVSEIPEELTCATLIVGDKVYHDSYWNGNGFVETEFKEQTIKGKLIELGVTDGYLITLDYHS